MDTLARALALLLAISPGPRHVAAGPVDGARPVLVCVTPEYPELARRMHVFGEVTVCAQIAADGTVAEAHATSGHPLLRRSAEVAVRHWRFAPAPDPSQATIRIEYHEQNLTPDPK